MEYLIHPRQMADIQSQEQALSVMSANRKFFILPLTASTQRPMTTVATVLNTMAHKPM